MMLIGMSLLKVQEESETSDTEETLDERVFSTTAAIAPVLLPLIEHLGGLSEEELNPWE